MVGQIVAGGLSQMRRLARELALQALFQMDFSEKMSLDLALEGALAAEHGNKNNEKQQAEALEYAKVLAAGVRENCTAVDAVIVPSLANWRMERLGKAEKMILRLAVYEIRFADEKVPAGVAVNEAVELAKLYGDDAAPKFVNGVLGKIVRAAGREK